MDKFLVSVCYRAICTILVSGIILLDLSYAYPSDHNTNYSTLGVPSLNQSRPVNDRVSSAHLEGAISASIRDIGDYYFGGSEGARSARANHGEDRAEQRFGKVLRVSGTEIMKIVPVEYIMQTAPDELNDALDGIGFMGELPREGVIFVLFKTGDDGRLLVQIARKDEVSPDNQPGYDWDISDKYLVKCLSEGVDRSVSSSALHHFPLYIWKELRPALNEAWKRGEISNATYRSIITENLGIARISGLNNEIIIEESVLPIVAEALNSTLRRSRPHLLTVKNVRRYLAYHEKLHLELNSQYDGRYEVIEALSAELKSLPDYNDIKDGFINNYGVEYRDDMSFAEELLVIYITETALMNQPPRVLRRGKKNRDDIPLGWIITLTESYFNITPSTNDRKNFLTAFLIPYINNNYNEGLEGGQIVSIDLDRRTVTVRYEGRAPEKMPYKHFSEKTGIDIAPIFVTKAVLACRIISGSISDAAPPLPEPRDIEAVKVFKQEFPDLRQWKIDKLFDVKPETVITRINRFRRYYKMYVTRLGITDEELPRLQENILKACYSISFVDSVRSLPSAFDIYQGMYGSTDLRDISEKEKLQLIIATYQIAQAKVDGKLPEIIRAYNAHRGITDWTAMSATDKAQAIRDTCRVATGDKVIDGVGTRAPAPSLHHFPLYIWKKLKPKLDEALGDGRIADDTYNLIVREGLGAARLGEDGNIVMEEDALVIIRDVLNTTLGRAPPDALTIDDIRNYLTYHERQHLMLRNAPGVVDSLSARLRSSIAYENIKQKFIDNYGREYSDDRAFAEELLAVYITEADLLKQSPRILLSGNGARQDIPIGWIADLTRGYFEIMPSVSHRDEFVSSFLIPYINNHELYARKLEGGRIESIDLTGGDSVIRVRYDDKNGATVQNISCGIFKAKTAIDLSPLFAARSISPTQMPNPNPVIAGTERPRQSPPPSEIASSSAVFGGGTPRNDGECGPRASRAARRPTADKALLGAALPLPSPAPSAPTPVLPPTQNIDAYIASFRRKFPDLDDGKVNKLLDVIKDKTKIKHIDMFVRCYNKYIARLGISDEDLPELRDDLFTACCSLAPRKSDESLTAALDVYQNMYGSTSLQDITVKEKRRLVKATCDIAMRKAGGGLPDIINAYNKQLGGIDNWQGLSQELKLQLVTATYEIARYKAGGGLPGIINAYNEQLGGIDNWQGLSQELQLKLIIATYVIAANKSGDKLPDIIKAYNKQLGGIDNWQGLSQELQLKLIIATYEIAMNKAGDDLPDIINTYNTQLGIPDWKELNPDPILNQELQLQLITATYAIAMNKAGGDLPGIINTYNTQLGITDWRELPQKLQLQLIIATYGIAMKKAGSKLPRVIQSYNRVHSPLNWQGLLASDNTDRLIQAIRDTYLVARGEKAPVAPLTAALHHFPLYIWKKLRPELDEALRGGRITSDTYNLIVHERLGAARLGEDGNIIIQDSALDIIMDALNGIFSERSPPGAAPRKLLTRDDIRSYLTYHEEQHLKLRGKPNNIVEDLSSELKLLPDYKEIKDGFINNYGSEYSDDTAFAEELLVIFITETNRLHQVPRILRTGKKKREDIPFNWITTLTQAYFKMAPPSPSSSGTTATPLSPAPVARARVSGVSQFMDLVESMVVSGRRRFVDAENRVIGVLYPDGDAEDVGGAPISEHMTTIEISQKAEGIIDRANTISAGNGTFPNGVRADMEYLKDNIARFEVDGFIGALAALSLKAKREGNQKLLVGFETDWIPGIEDEHGRDVTSGLESHKDRLDKYLRSIGVDNVEIVYRKSEELAGELSRRIQAGQTTMSNIVILASSVTAAMPSFRPFMDADGNDRPFIAIVNPENLERWRRDNSDPSKQLDMDMIKLLCLALELAIGKDAPEIPLISGYDKDRRLLYLLPPAEPKSYTELLDIDRSRKKILWAA